MLNAIGLQTRASTMVVRRILPELDFSETRFVANVSGSTIEEYVEVTRRFDQSPIDAIEINISCPNVKEGWRRVRNYPDMSAQVVQACRRVTGKPLITKLSPNQTDISRECPALHRGRPRMRLRHQHHHGYGDRCGFAPAHHRQHPGWTVGPCDQAIALLKVHQVYEVARRHHVPIIGQGGITTAADALEFIIAGASAVGIGTSLFTTPWWLRKSTRVYGSTWNASTSEH